jgi:hypothetical protein
MTIVTMSLSMEDRRPARIPGGQDLGRRQAQGLGSLARQGSGSRRQEGLWSHFQEGLGGLLEVLCQVGNYFLGSKSCCVGVCVSVSVRCWFWFHKPTLSDPFSALYRAHDLLVILYAFGSRQ